MREQNVDGALSFAKTIPDPVVVELGCISAFLYSKVKHIRPSLYIGVNIIYTVEDLRNSTGIIYRIFGDMHRLPIIAGTIDMVVISATLHHAADLNTCIAEISRILKPNGLLVFANEPVLGVFRRWGKLAETERIDKFSYQENRYPYSTYARVLQRSGMTGRPIFPKYVTCAMQNKQFEGNYGASLARHFAFLFKYKVFMSFFERLTTRICLYLFGIPLVWVGRKTSSGSKATKMHI
jgi:ubiquinone/menaquinone biosynthesis C-methylase UbiE